MQLIAWRVGRSNPVVMLLGAVFATLLAHICCVAPLLVPLGLSGAGTVLGKVIETLQPWLYGLSISILVYTGWKIHRNPKSHMIEKVVYWITVVFVGAIILL